MADNQPGQSLTVESAAVQHHLTLMQGVIQRMAENSRSCKLWCITIVAAVLVLVARTEQPNYALIALLPALLFLILDTYYLALERAFRNSYNAFVRKLHSGELNSSDLYKVAPTRLHIPAFSCLPEILFHLAFLPGIRYNDNRSLGDGGRRRKAGFWRVKCRKNTRCSSATTTMTTNGTRTDLLGGWATLSWTGR